MKIGIEFLSTIKIINGMASYTGGANYAKGVLYSILEDDKYMSAKVILILPMGFKVGYEDSVLFNSTRFERIYTNYITKDVLKEIDVLFMPQVNGSILRIIPKIKSMKSSIKIYATLHDRQHNYYKFDWKDRYYYSGVKGTGIPLIIEFYVKKIMFNILYGYAVKYVDKIFTVSNYSMQKLMHKNVKNIKWFVQRDIFENVKKTQCDQLNFVLFVSGGRPEKNLLRTLEAFCLFKKKCVSDTKMVVTGVNNDLAKKIKNYHGIDNKVMTDSISFMPYVTYNELMNLYSSCKYVVFTSKGEGYGLPVREAMGCGKTVMASKTTSIPEVAGASLYYVDPFDVKSIAEGFSFLDISTNLHRLERHVNQRYHIIQELAEQDKKIFLDELFIPMNGETNENNN